MRDFVLVSGGEKERERKEREIGKVERSVKKVNGLGERIKRSLHSGQTSSFEQFHII